MLYRLSKGLQPPDNVPTPQQSVLLKPLSPCGRCPPRLIVLLSLLLSKAVANPDRGSVCVYSKAGCVAAFRPKTNGAETDLPGKKAIRNYACWETNDLQAKGKLTTAVLAHTPAIPQPVHA